MPELPEVETTCQGIRTTLQDSLINEIIVRNPNLRWPIPIEITKLKKIKILNVTRRAKYILLTTNKGTLIIHLGMSGRLSILTQNTENPKKHDHVDFILNNNYIMRYTDPRRFGAILWTTECPTQYPLLAKLGCEPLTKDLTAPYLLQWAKRKKIFIKQFIMDQQIVVGVGNIYANEALFLAKISPLRLSNTLTLLDYQNLIKSIKKVLKEAIKQGGTTLRDFMTPEGKHGYFAQKLAVYGREGRPCLRCGETLLSSRIGQRATVFCAICQN